MAGYADDHIICNITTNNINGVLSAGQEYTNTYTCTNTYPRSPLFPAIKLGLLAKINTGSVQSLQVAGSCATQPLASGETCQFQLAVRLQQSVSLNVRVVIGEGLYTIQQPLVVATVNSTPSTPVITWSGCSFALTDGTNNGTGGFFANAVDSSGHSVTYLFNIIAGPGSVTGYQTGYFTLAGVDATTVVQITATADDAPPVVSAPIPVQVPSVPTKVMAIYNNTNETIYPIIETPMTGTVPPLPESRDTWLQAQFAIADGELSTKTFTSTQLYRAYINGVNGIAPKQAAFVLVPFYSEVVPNPAGGTTPNQYVDWWKSMRLYIYDVQSNVVQTQSESGVNALTLNTSGPTCACGCSQVSIFSAVPGLPTNDPSQLFEYTYATVLDQSPAPYPIDRTIVNYNISGVDQIYLPAAMEPFGISTYGYTGTVVDLQTFRNSLNLFLSETVWPVYAGLPYPRIPSAYNVVINNGNPSSQLTDSAPQTAQLTANWTECVNNPVAPNHANCVLVNTLFQDDWSECNAGLPPIDSLIHHIYGYVSFCGAELPSNGPSFDAYTTLQHSFNPNYQGDFNPYTQLIHQTLLMNIYAYSVDDAIGFQSTAATGNVITVGGAFGLPNGNQL